MVARYYLLRENGEFHQHEHTVNLIYISAIVNMYVMIACQRGLSGVCRAGRCMGARFTVATTT